MSISAYNYKELREKATAQNATAGDRLNLFFWFEAYGGSYWNGEFYDMDDGWRLYPVYEEDEDGELELIDAEIR